MRTAGILLDGLDLRKGFEAFIEASKRLEKSYDELQERARAIDLRLAEANAELERTLRERETIFRSLPVGVLVLDSLRAGAEPILTNPEGQRLLDLAALAGVDLLRAPEGEVEAPELNLRLQRVDLPDEGQLIVVEDRSQVVYLEREVDRLDRLAGLSELALGIAHEIKNPLNGVMGFGSLMLRTQDSDKQQGYARRINEGLARVDAIVKGLLEFSQPSETTARREPLSRIIAEAAMAGGIPLAWVHLLAGENLVADSSALVRVLANLFRNSAEAKDSEVEIRAQAEAVDDNLVILVSDDGPGVPAELGSRIFEPFVSSKGSGHGLGLALASRVLSFLGGSIELVNPGECGAVFRVTTPQATTTEVDPGC